MRHLDKIFINHFLPELHMIFVLILSKQFKLIIAGIVEAITLNIEVLEIMFCNGQI